MRGRRWDDDTAERHAEQIAHTDKLIEKYLRKHDAVAGAFEIERRHPVHGLTMRLALSCLVDADHSDAAFFRYWTARACSA